MLPQAAHCRYFLAVTGYCSTERYPQQGLLHHLAVLFLMLEALCPASHKPRLMHILGEWAGVPLSYILTNTCYILQDWNHITRNLPFLTHSRCRLFKMQFLVIFLLFAKINISFLFKMCLFLSLHNIDL